MSNQSREITVRIEFTAHTAKYNYPGEDFYEEEMGYFEPESTDFISSMRELNLTEFADLFDGAERWICYSPPTLELTFFSNKSDEELKKLKEEIAGQMSDGWGEGYEQQAFRSNEGNEVFLSPVWDEIVMRVDGQLLGVEQKTEEISANTSHTAIDMDTVKAVRKECYVHSINGFKSAIKGYLMGMLSDVGYGEYTVRLYLQSLADKKELNSVLVFAMEEALIREGVLSEDTAPFYIATEITDGKVQENLTNIAVRRFAKDLGGRND